MSKQRHAAIIIYPGFDELDAFGPFEVLRMAGTREEMDVQLAVEVGPGTHVQAAHGTAVEAPLDLSSRTWDLVIVPGGGWGRRLGAFAEVQRTVLPRRLSELHAGGTITTSVCTGAMLLAAAGMTKGRPATTHPIAMDDLRATGTDVVPARIVDDGDIITSGPITSGIDLGLWLARRYFGADRAEKVAERLGYQLTTDVVIGSSGTCASP
jgi:transcriptional regulator GlxA family with amidase domain